MKKAISIILACVLAFCCAAPAFALSNGKTELLNIYGDNMIFQQKSPVVINGTCLSGAAVLAELIDSEGGTVTYGKTTASKSGTFSVVFDAPAGSYENYTIKVYENGVQFSELKNVAFGEVWLASGQSNMQYPLVQCHDGSKMFENHENLDEWIRVFEDAGETKVNGSSKVYPYAPQTDIEGAYWSNGNDYAVSAVAYWFALKLRNELDMPVGIINASLGGSYIDTWLPREGIDNSPFADYLKKYGEYIPASGKNGEEQSQYSDMCANFDLKINPLRPFTFAGMIWYQGESDCISDHRSGYYTEAVEVMQKSYSAMFANGGTLPFIFTSLASYDYTDRYSCYEMNAEFTAIQQKAPSSRALISIYDIPLDYYENVGSIHPAYKKPVGERMADCALGLVYGSDDTYTTATVSDSEIRDGSVFVTFRNTGRGLACTGNILSGFSVCGSDGVYIQADAEIVNENTVRIWADSVKEPAGAAYAYGLSNQNANLAAVSEKGTAVPAALFVTSPAENARYTKFVTWTDCEEKECWRVISSSEMNSYYSVWNSEKGDAVIEESAAFSGKNGLRITGGKGTAAFPAFTYRRNNRDYICTDVETDFSDYGTLSFMVKNNGETDARIKMKIFTNKAVWYSPLSGEETVVSVPADGEWHSVEFNLNALKLWGMKTGASYGNEKLDRVKYLKICLQNGADICADEFRFASDGRQTVKTEYHAAALFDIAAEALCRVFTIFDKLIYGESILPEC